LAVYVWGRSPLPACHLAYANEFRNSGGHPDTSGCNLTQFRYKYMDNFPEKQIFIDFSLRLLK
jgi:hypothetical protein